MDEASRIDHRSIQTSKLLTNQHLRYSKPRFGRDFFVTLLTSDFDLENFWTTGVKFLNNDKRDARNLLI